VKLRIQYVPLIIAVTNWVVAVALILTGASSALGFQMFSVGSLALGYFPAGIVSVGVFSAGVVSVGLLSFGIFSVGVVSIGVFNIGVFSIGIYVWTIYRGLKAIRRLKKAKEAGR
jgi:hypothetical protein